MLGYFNMFGAYWDDDDYSDSYDESDYDSDIDNYLDFLNDGSRVERLQRPLSGKSYTWPPFVFGGTPGEKLFWFGA